jgi:acyl carrier protein
MTGRPLQPPAGGDEAPKVSSPLAGGDSLDLVALATAICEQYRLEYPDEQVRYGDAGVAWCVHDNQHLLNWATESVNGHVDIEHEVAWLATVLEARDFPAERLARDLEIGADVILGRVGGTGGRQLAAVLTATAGFVRSGNFRDYTV